MNKNNSKQSGVALLMSLGILALISILGVTFSTNMRLMERTTRDFIYGMQARYLAEGGLEYAIAQLKDNARSSFVYNGIGNNDTINSSNSNLPAGVNVKIIDTARQININNANDTLLGCLPGIGSGPGSLGEGIVNYRKQSLPGNRYLTKRSICLAGGLGDPNDPNSTYSGIANFITTDTYIDENTMTETEAFEPRSAININTLVENTTSETMLREILDAVDGFGSGPNSDNVTKVVNSLKGNSSKPIESWAEFNTLIESANITAGGGLTKVEMENNIKNTFNPNRKKPSSTYPTEFCFHSGGTYELTATGTVTKGIGGSSQIVAQKTINIIVEIFNLWNQTTKEQFVISGSGSYKGVTWEDSCPVRSDDNWNCGVSKEEGEYDDTSHSTNYLIIKNALKMGYWDEFNSQGAWEPKIGNISFDNGVADMSEGSTMILGKDILIWSFKNCSATINAEERVKERPNWGNYSPNPLYNTIYYIGWFIFRYVGSGNEDSCSQTYIERKLDENGNWKEDVSPPRSPFVYTVKPIENKWVPGEEDHPGWEQATEFFINKTYRVVQNESLYNLYMISGDDTTNFNQPLVSGNSRDNVNGGQIKLYAGTWALGGEGGTHWDNLRVITDIGEYTAVPSDQAYNPLTLSNPVEWGTVWGTVTRPDSVKNITDVDIKIEVPPADGTEMEFSNGAPITAQNSTGIQYQANLYSIYDATNNPYLETPVLEDVWITYLPKTKILYWRE